MRARDADLLGYERGSPEWRQFVVTGEMPDPAARPMTAQERAQWGIPATDTTPYKMTDNGPVAIGGGGTTINNNMGGTPELGKLSTDYTYLTNEDGSLKRDEKGLPIAVPVPGSPAAREAETTADKTEKRAENAAGTATIVLDDINKAIEKQDPAGIYQETFQVRNCGSGHNYGVCPICKQGHGHVLMERGIYSAAL
jgi:hypothetical protein